MLPLLDGLGPVLAAEAGAAAPQAAPRQPGFVETIVPLVPFFLILAIFFWWQARSQRKRQQERQAMLDSLRPKDEVITIGGILGRVVAVRDDEIVLRVDPEKDVKITVTKGSISRKVGQEEPQ